MNQAAAVTNSELELVRLTVLDRLAALLESQTRSKHTTGTVLETVYSVQSDMARNLRGFVQTQSDHASLSNSVLEVAAMCERLNDSLDVLLGERQRRLSKNSIYLRTLMSEFNSTLDRLSETLIEKDLLERQSQVLERIILSYENITQWKEFARHILADFHRIFPFNIFFIIFSEGQNISLHLYYPGQHTQAAREHAQCVLIEQILAELQLPADTPWGIEEFLIDQGETPQAIEKINTIMVSIPEHAHHLLGLLGIGYVAGRNLSAQEQTIIRSILSVMVMVVGSSKALSRTMADLEFYAAYDSLTGLHNRRYFNEMLEYEIERSSRHRHEFSILLLDLDDFKDVNDSYGHPVGDETLRGVAAIVNQHTRKGDLATRLGGDEFAILLMETGAQGARAVAEKLGIALREKTFLSPQHRHFQLTASIGIVTYPHDAGNESDLMSGVDLAMYRAKRMGKDSACALDGAEKQIGLSRGARDNVEQLRKTLLQQDKVFPYFQPIVDCRTGTIFAYETLARLQQVDGEIVTAGAFIEVIEKYGLGRQLDQIIIGKALEAHKLSGTSTKLFINLSAQEIQGRNILGYAENLCERLEISPSAVVFEILERDAIGDMGNMRRFLTMLGKKGFSFALDDFGSGYNSFHYLRELHFEFVKIDGIFVRNIIESKVDRTLVRNLSRLCRDLGILTVAEFVENEEIFSMLRDMDIDYVQGYHIGMPRAQLSPQLH
ncbi:GGDEF and EAL domain-containing protein [Candidatus Methylospira mobilis]|uniref:GGDEF and EAL domain-containing protein n=1 Tax=Candidatus Methylospira mobilis TaxID=1808979 RepID=A0A5Q0BK25_9GAMM|nr:GGDEF and EAL domain-containing protein [Candidatus Methylospira mobilis]QFY42551.1 GGDEF and EAL domain-containing protein [Candidatus Methylospira mobilis]